MMNQILFSNRNEFRNWLEVNKDCDEGIWIVFDKTEEKKKLTAAEALEEALCFGWIDGQIKSLDETKYIKYFKERRKGSMWSEKNKNIAARLIAQGIMTDYGLEKISRAKKDGTWDEPSKVAVSEDVVDNLARELTRFDQAYANFMKMAPSARRGYAMHYFMAKSEATKQKRLGEIIERLEKNLKPMEKDISKTQES